MPPTWKGIEGNAGGAGLVPGNFLESCRHGHRETALSSPGMDCHTQYPVGIPPSRQSWWLDRQPGGMDRPLPAASQHQVTRFSAKLQGSWLRGDTSLQPPAASAWTVNIGNQAISSAFIVFWRPAERSSPLVPSERGGTAVRSRNVSVSRAHSSC